jgi:hypothetical protein
VDVAYLETMKDSKRWMELYQDLVEQDHGARRVIRSQGSCMERGGTTRHSLPDPAETLRRLALLLMACTQRRRSPIQVKKVPAKMPAAKTVPIACNGLCLTVCFASSIASSAA